LARHRPRRPLGVDVERQAQGGARPGDRGGRAGADPGGARAARRTSRDRGEESGRLFRPGGHTEPGAAAPHQGPPPGRVSTAPTIDKSCTADYLLSAAAVRERCGVVFAAAERGETRHFRLVPERLDDAVERVVVVTRRRFPDLAVPLHSRWRHFGVGGVDRAALVAPGADPAERARARLDLAIVSVLLDAGAGAGWCYRESETGLVLARSEGLAV